MTDRGSAEATRLIVALDGPASSGKSSVGAAAAAILGYRFCDTGLLYRAITWLALADGVDLTDEAALVALAPRISLAPDDQGRLSRVVVDGRDVTSDARSADVDRRVSEVARLGAVRTAVLPVQRELALGGGIVMAGRDIGSVILPDADLKLYLDASAEERARRRAEERGLDPDGPEAQDILEALRRRDAIDSGREVAPLRVAPDAVVLRTDGAGFDETVARVVAAIRAKEAERTAPVVAGPPPAPSADAAPAPRGSAGARAARSDTDQEPVAQSLTPFISGTALVARTAMRGLTRVHVVGALDRIPRSGPLIVAANHLSNADGVLIGGWLTPALGRRMHWMGKKEMFEWPLMGPLLRAGSVHSVDRGGSDVEAFRVAQRILDGGGVLLVFPEGTRSPTGGLQKPRDGVALLALRTGAAILPVGVSGTDRFWPRGKAPHPGGSVTLRVGEAFTLADVLGDAKTDRKAAKARATDAIMDQIAALLPARHKGAYGPADAVPTPPPSDPRTESPVEAASGSSGGDPSSP